MAHQLHFVFRVDHIVATVTREGSDCPEKGTVFVQVERERGIYAVHEVYQSSQIHLHTNLGNTLICYFSFSEHRHTLEQFSS